MWGSASDVGVSPTGRLLNTERWAQSICVMMTRDGGDSSGVCVLYGGGGLKWVTDMMTSLSDWPW